MATRDIDIRRALHEGPLRYHHEDPEAIVLDEFGVCLGHARVDIAIVNGALHGVEIKSEKDSLERLPGQISFYNKVFDQVTVVAGPRHIERIAEMVPDWWAITEARSQGASQVTFHCLREPQPNWQVEPLATAQLLWKNEALEILTERGLDKGVRSKPCNKLWERLAASLPLSELQVLVREALKARADWRADRRLT